MQISAFDLDHTLVKKNASFLFYHYLVYTRFYHPLSISLSLYYTILYQFFALSLQELHEKIFNFFLKGVSISSIRKKAELFLSQDFHHFLYYPALSRLRLAQHKGDYTVILSNSPSFLVAPIANYLEVDEWHSSIYSVDQKGIFKGIDSILLGNGKALYIQNLAKKFQIDLKQVTAYSDDIQDLPFLSKAGRAVIVSPYAKMNSKMKKISQEKSWEVI